MASTKDTTKEKSSKDFTKKKEEILKGTLQVVPDCDFDAGVTYKCEGLGIFSGSYYAEKVTHTITQSGYSVDIDVHRKEAPSKAPVSSKNTGSSTSSGNGSNGKRNTGNVEVVALGTKTGSVTTTYLSKLKK